MLLKIHSVLAFMVLRIKSFYLCIRAQIIKGDFLNFAVERRAIKVNTLSTAHFQENRTDNNSIVQIQ